MGIRFRCPNGHKLHVKVFLAGKRGICPKCGAKFQIPEESDPELVKNSQHSDADPANDDAAAAAEMQAEDTGRPLDGLPGPVIGSAGPTVDEVPVINPTPNARPADQFDAEIDVRTASIESQTQNQRTDEVPSEGKRVEAPKATAKAVLPGAPDTSSASDPITEAPHAVWYVRPPSGGQFGPASGDIMRSWISEGRVTIDSLVWREGWPEWKQAGATFPGMLAPSAALPAAEIPQIVTNPSGGTSAELYRRRKSTKTTLSVVVLLILACIILFGALVYVVKFMN